MQDGRDRNAHPFASPQRAIQRRINSPAHPVDNQFMFDFDLICLGCGPAGEKAATQAAYFKHRVAVVEQNATPGGAMVNTGTLPSKALRETALLCSAFNRRPLPGTTFRIDHNVSVNKFMARRHLIEQQEHDRIETSFDRHAIEFVCGRGRIVDPHTVEVTSKDGRARRLTSAFILVATGSSPLRPEHIPFHHPAVVDADGVLGLQRIPASMIIVGGGVIGCEYACIFAEIGVHVTLVHPQAHVLPFVDAECREHLLDAMREQGITFQLNRSVATVMPQQDDSILVQFEDGGSISAEVLLWAAGRCSNTRDIGLESVGVKLGQRGLVEVNEHYQTNVSSIYAAGDVIGWPALAATSMEQGRIAACHMFGIDFKHKLGAQMPIGLYTIPAVSMIGVTAAQAHDAGLDVVVGRALYRYNARGRMLGDEQGIAKCVFDRRSRKLLGATIVGEDATELIHLGQFVMAHGGGIDDFIHVCFNYPSLSELYKYAAYSALQEINASRATARPLAA
jgi:NAD(P) transhydrogenase